MQDAPNRFVSEEATTAPTRSLGLIGILASLVAFALGMGVWLGVFAGLIFVGALLFDGMASINALIEDFDRFDPLRLGSDVGAQRAMFAGGVLIYLQMVDRRIEILADRGVAARVAQTSWDAICRTMEVALREGRHQESALHGVREITALLARHFPAGSRDADELPDRPLLL